MQPKTEGFLEVRGTNLFYKYNASSSDKPTLVVIPGGPGFGFEIYEPCFLPFINLVNLLFFDPRGCGKSSFLGNMDACSIENNVLDLKVLIESLGKKFGFNRVILQGTSYGSMLAQGFASRYPEMITQLILVSGSPSYEFIDLAKAELARRGDQEQKRICEQYLWPGKFDLNSMSEYSKQTSTLYSYKTHEKKVRNAHVAFNVTVLNRAFSSQFDLFDFTNDLKSIKCPTLILAGKHDWINPPVLAQKTHQHIESSELIIFEESGHSIFRDVPEQYKAAIFEFLKKHIQHLKEFSI